jgi:hypothetical protein
LRILVFKLGFDYAIELLEWDLGSGRVGEWEGKYYNLTTHPPIHLPLFNLGVVRRRGGWFFVFVGECNYRRWH